jgi:ABC-2 type transport system permease protein
VVGLGIRQWWSTAWLAGTAYVGESRLFLLDYAIRGLRVVVLLSIWRSIVEARPDASPIPLAALLSYTVVSEVFASALSIHTRLSDSIWQGTLVHYLLRPAGVVRQFAAEASGQWAVDFLLFSIPLLLVAPLLGVDVAPASPLAALLFAASLVLAVAVGLAIEFIFAAFSLMTDQPIWLIEYVRRAIAGILSGALIPLAILPWGLGDLFGWLPFAATAWAPLAIYTGMAAAGPLLLLQLAWAAVLWPLALLLWSRNRENVVIHGG